MEALRKIIKINNDILKFDIPVNFNSKYVEVIILPYKKNEVSNKKNDLTELQQLLLTAPIIEDSENKYFEEKKKHFEEWK